MWKEQRQRHKVYIRDKIQRQRYMAAVGEVGRSGEVWAGRQKDVGIKGAVAGGRCQAAGIVCVGVAVVH